MLGFEESYSSARLHLAQAEDTSGLETDAGDQSQRKRKRTVLTFSDESDVEAHKKVRSGGRTKRTAQVSGNERATDHNTSLLQPPVPMDLNFTAVIKSFGQSHYIILCVLLNNYSLLKFSIANKFQFIMRCFIKFH